MKSNVFTGGVNLLGLKSKNDIKLLICYLLASIDVPLSKEDIITILQDNELANYFEINDAISDLLDNNNITYLQDDLTKYLINNSGREIADNLSSSLPISIREKALVATMKLMAKVKRETENTVDIISDKSGFYVECHISGGKNFDLLSFKIFVADKRQAELVKNNFQKNPNFIYQCMMALVSEDTELINDALKSLPLQNNTCN